LPEGKQRATSSVAPGAITALLRDVFRSSPLEGRGALPACRPGQVVGRFELVREIGRGGFGVVYEARDQQLGRSVALKAVRMGGDVDLKEERLLREAEAAAQLSHPNIVTLHDVGSFERGPYLVMELLRGQTLGERLGRGAIPAHEALPIAVDVARAVAHAHANGVTHRDLTAGNVFLCDDGHVKVLDFGMAQAFGRRKVDGGTRAYMAPEQCRGAPEDERTDVFALGVILHQMLAGTVPFPDASALQSEQKAPTLQVPEEAAVGDLVARMLEKDPVKRPRDGREVLAALTSLKEAVARTVPTGLPVQVRAPRRRPRRLLLKAASVVFLVGVALVVANSRTTSGERDEGSSASTQPSSAGGLATSAPATGRVASEPTAIAAIGDEPPLSPQLGVMTPPPRAAPARPSPRVRHCRGSINAVPTPRTGTGNGVLTIEADPFGDVFVNDSPYGETPGECLVAAGAYKVRVVHPELGAREARVVVKAGMRTRWTADFLADR
jgi:serine/threonine protein kinase